MITRSRIALTTVLSALVATALLSIGFAGVSQAASGGL